MSAKRLFNSPLARLLVGSQVVAVLFLIVTNGWPVSVFHRFAIAFVIASPLLFGIPMAETYYRSKDGSLQDFYREVFKAWALMIPLAFIFEGLALLANMAPPLAFFLAIAGGIAVPLFGAMSASFFKRMTERGLM